MAFDRADSRAYRRRLMLLMSGVAGVNVGYTVVLPYLQQIAAAARLGPLGLSVFFSGFAVCCAAIQPFGGMLVDRVGAAKVLLGAFALSALGLAAVAFASDPAAAIAGRLLWGACDGAATPALYQAVSSLARTHRADPSAALARLGAMVNAAIAAGPAIVAVSDQFTGYRGLLVCCAVLSVLDALLVFRIAPRRPEPAGHNSEAETRPQSPGTRLQALALYCAMNFVTSVMSAAIEVLIPLTVGGASTAATTRAAVMLTTGTVVFVLSITVRSAGRLNAAPLWAAVALAVYILAFLGLERCADPAAGYPAMCVAMAAQAGIYLAVRSGLERHTAASGRDWGMFGMAGSAGYVVGPAVALNLARTSPTRAFEVVALLCTGSLVLLAPFLARLSARTRCEARHARPGTALGKAGG